MAFRILELLAATCKNQQGKMDDDDKQKLSSSIKKTFLTASNNLQRHGGTEPQDRSDSLWSNQSSIYLDMPKIDLQRLLDFGGNV